MNKESMVFVKKPSAVRKMFHKEPLNLFIRGFL
jgi:hypothetical protein